MVGHVEACTAALRLIQLWLMCARRAPATHPDLEGRLATFHHALQQTIADMARNANTTRQMPAEYHRLHLLESSLRKNALELLTGLLEASEMDE